MLWLLILKILGLKKKRSKKNRFLQKKLNDSRIWNFRMSRTRSQFKNRKHICKPKKYLKNILLKFIKSILISLNITKKVQTDKKRCEYILFIIDVYFSEYFLAAEIDEKDHNDRDLIFEEKKARSIRKKTWF